MAIPKVKLPVKRRKGEQAREGPYPSTNTLPYPTLPTPPGPGCIVREGKYSLDGLLQPSASYACEGMSAIPMVDMFMLQALAPPFFFLFKKQLAQLPTISMLLLFTSLLF